MSNISEEKPLEIIEVPPELQGPSDEEILKMSERPLREVSGKRKKGERRPSKRMRQALKQQKQFQEAHSLAIEMFSSTKNNPVEEQFVFENKDVSKTMNFYSLSENKQKLVSNAFTIQSKGFSTFPTNASETLASKVKSVLQSKADSNPAPTSGRVLKASFGSKTSEKPKAVIVSAAELAKQKAEERAKKIREALMAKKKSTALPSDPQEPSGAAIDQPVKRPRGRPRKNPEL